MDKLSTNLKANIHSIVSMSTVDGDGIRYTIFMQGCNLRCKFCHNPDTWSHNINKLVNVNELYNNIIKCKPYFDLSNGGVTFTGGEPLLQYEFLTVICRMLKEKNINIIIDTAGNIDMNKIDNYEELLRTVDLVVLDIKHINPIKNKWLTGVDNKNTLEFARYLSDNNIPISVRQVYLPGITDESIEDLITLGKYLNELKTLKKFEVLPYHNMGEYKWKELGFKYELVNQKIPTDEECEKLKKIILNKNI